MSKEHVDESPVTDTEPVAAPAARILGSQIGNRALSALVQRSGGTLPRAPGGQRAVARLARQLAQRRVLAREATREERIEGVVNAIAAARAGSGSWKDVAVRLNGLSTGDITRQTAGLTSDELAATRQAAERDLRDSGWPIQHLLDGIDATAASKGFKLRPRGNSIWNAYAAVRYNPNPPGSGSWSGVTGAQAWDIIGGQIGQGFGPASNSCAGRLSYAFNYGGYPIRETDTGWIYYNDPKVTYDKPVPESVLKKAGDAKRYIVSAPYMEQYLTRKWGKRDANLKTNDDAKTFAQGLSDDQVAIFAGIHHVGVIRKYTPTNYKDAYLFSDPSVMPASAWILP